MIINFKIFEMSKLQYPISRSGKVGGEGTHVMVLPSDEYYKKHWNKVGYVTVDSRGSFRLHDMSVLSNTNKQRLSEPGQFCSLYHTNSKPGVHFDWIDNSTIYDNQGNVVGK